MRGFVVAALLAAVASAGCDRTRHDRPASVELPPAPGAPPTFLKGQLHAHSNRSGDSETPPEEVVAWYAAHGYDFLVLTDHNYVTVVPPPRGLLLFPGVEITRNLRTCDPPPLPRAGCLLHVNALFVARGDGPTATDWTASSQRIDIYASSVANALSMGGIAQLDHPNFHSGADASVIVGLASRGLLLVEIANQAVDSENEEDARHPSTEALWDEALGRGAHVFGTATDDAHHYGDAAWVRARGETAYVGDRGFVMVRADKSAAGIRAAVERGDFYSSTGVLLDRVELSARAIAVDVHPDGSLPRIEVIAGGRVIEETRGLALRFDPRGAATGYVRVRITGDGGRRAWTQPVWLAGR